METMNERDLQKLTEKCVSDLSKVLPNGIKVTVVLTLHDGNEVLSGASSTEEMYIVGMVFDNIISMSRRRTK